MVLASIAVLGKEVWRGTAAPPACAHIAAPALADSLVTTTAQNNPLYIRAFGRSQQEQPEDNLLRFHFIVHTALDFVEEKSTPCPPAPPPTALVAVALPSSMSPARCHVG